jgi:hypothetical protein
MKYWGYFCAKLAFASGLLYLVWLSIPGLLPPPNYRPRFPYDLPSTLAIGAFFLLCCGALYLVLLDQRFRCRVCVRRLRMPVQTGSWSMMLQFGRPKIEYICPYGHGTLKVPEVQIAGMEQPDWEAHKDIWEELRSAGKDET